MNINNIEHEDVAQIKPLKGGMKLFADAQNEDYLTEDAPQPEVSKNGADKDPKEEAIELHKKIIESLAISLGTSNEVDQKSRHQPTKTIKKLKGLEELAEAEQPLVPQELVDVERILNQERPLLFKNGTTTADGRIAWYLYGRVAEPYGGVGWFAVDKKGKYHRIKDTTGLIETPKTYNVASPQDMQKKQTNDAMIRGIVASTISAQYDLLLSRYRIGTTIIEKGNAAFIRVTERGALALTPIYSSRVPTKSVEPILKSWAISVGLSWDDFQDQPIVTYLDSPNASTNILNDDDLDTLWSTLSMKYGINIPTTGIKKIVMKLAKQNRVNTYTSEMLDIEMRSAAGEIAYEDHTTIASRYLKITGSPEMVALHNQQMALWVESMVAKALFPGCYFRYIPVLIGPQDVGKSRVGKIFARDLRFHTELAGLHSGTGHNCIASNEIKMMRCVRKIILVDEIDSSIKSSSTGQLKSWLEATYSEYRPLYQQNLIKRPIHAALLGTSNNREILKDPTGNNRFWMIPVGLTEDDPLDDIGLRNAVEGLLASAIRSLRAKVAADPDAMHKLKLDPELRKVNDRFNLECLGDSPLTLILEDVIYRSADSIDNANGEVQAKRQFVHAKEAQRVVLGESGSVFDPKMSGEIDKAMNVLGYTKLAPMKIAGKAHQKLYSLRDKDGHAPKPNRSEPCDDFKTIIDDIKRIGKGGDF